MSWIGPAMIVVCVGLAIYKNKTLGLTFYPILGFLVTAFCVDLTAYYLAANRINNMPLLHGYTIVEYILLAWYFRIVLSGMVPRKIIQGVSFVFVGLAVANSIFLQDIFRYNTYSRTLEGLLVIWWCLSVYYKILKEMKIQRLQDAPVFWIVTGHFFYFSGALLLFVLSNSILYQNKTLYVYAWKLHAVINFLHYSFIAIGIWKATEN
ncbi:MAG: hypothetical protein R2792_04625 [Saprospiraceae bacterium]